jgi:hypothetical protein
MLDTRSITLLEMELELRKVSNMFFLLTVYEFNVTSFVHLHLLCKISVPQWNGSVFLLTSYHPVSLASDIS